MVLHLCVRSPMDALNSGDVSSSVVCLTHQQARCLTPPAGYSRPRLRRLLPPAYAHTHAELPCGRHAGAVLLSARTFLPIAHHVVRLDKIVLWRSGGHVVQKSRAGQPDPSMSLTVYLLRRP